MLAEGIKKIEDLAVAASKLQTHEEHGITYLVDGKGSATPLLQPLVKALEVRTLGAVVSYLEENRDELVLSDLTVVVAGPGRVVVVGKARHDGRRTVHLEALQPDVAVGFDAFVNRYQAIEDFVVGAQQRFRQGLADLPQLLAVVGNITQNDVRNVADDGVSQEVTAKVGIVKVGTTPLPNPCLLVPRRSFPEIILDAVPFVVRVKRGDSLPAVGLFEADGGAWTANATAKIASWIGDTWANRHEGDDAPFGILA